MTQATPVTFGLSGTPVFDGGSVGTLVEPVSSGNATPVILSIDGAAMPVNLSLVPVPSQATSWFDQVVTNGGTVSSLQRVRVSLLISSLVASGAWALLDDAWLLAAESSIQALTSLKQLRLGTAVAAPPYVAGRGYTLDGLTQYVNTGFVLSTSIVSATPSNIRFAQYILNDPNSALAAGTVTASANRRLLMVPRDPSTGRLIGSANSMSGTWTLPSATPTGFSVVGRNGAAVTDAYAYKNGTALVRVSAPSAVGATLPGLNLLIGATNSTGSVVIDFNTYQTAWSSIGATLSAAQESAVYQAIKAYLVSWGVSQ